MTTDASPGRVVVVGGVSVVEMATCLQFEGGNTVLPFSYA